MKKLLFAISLLITFNSFCQTTEEEFNYITKGYKVQVASGLDMKRGYSFVDIPLLVSFNETGRYCEFKALNKVGVKSPVAVMMVYHSPTLGDIYLCIPHPKSERYLWKLVDNQLQTNISGSFVNELSRVWVYSLMQLSALGIMK